MFSKLQKTNSLNIEIIKTINNLKHNYKFYNFGEYLKSEIIVFDNTKYLRGTNK